MRDIIRKLKRKLKPADVEERCGLILKTGKVFQVENIHSNPSRGFMVSGEDLYRYEDLLIGTWHTHPGMTASLSQEDYAGFGQWPDLLHFIVGTDGVRAYKVDDGFVQEVDLAGF